MNCESSTSKVENKFLWLNIQTNLKMYVYMLYFVDYPVVWASDIIKKKILEIFYETEETKKLYFNKDFTGLKFKNVSYP